MGEQITDLQYVEELLAEFSLRPSDRIADLIDALEAEEEEAEDE